jgi:hypothetical protein
MYVQVTTQLIAQHVFLTVKNALAYYNAADVPR